MNPKFNEQIEKMQKQVQNHEEISEPICIELGKTIFTWPQANAEICEYAHYIWTQSYQNYQNLRHYGFKVCRVKYLESYYWLREGYWLSCLVRIGANSQLLIVPNSVADEIVEESKKAKLKS